MLTCFRMDRRTVLAGSLAVATAGIAGCFGGDAEPTNAADDTGEDDDGDEDSDDGNGDGTANGPSDSETVAYEDLSERAQSFVNAAEDHHELTVIDEGDGPVYLEAGTDGYEAVDDPLVPEELGESLQTVIDGDASLERAGSLYRVVTELGHDFYGERYELTAADECEDETKSLEDTDDERRALLETLRSEKSLSVANGAFEAVSNADEFIDPDRSVRWYLAETFLEDGRCLAANGDTYRLTVTDEFMVELIGFRLEQVE